MAKAKVQLPDGRVATIEIPDGMSMEEAQAELETMYDSQPEAFGVQASAPTQNVAQAPAQAPAQPQAQEGSWLDNLPHYQIPRGMITGEADNSMAAYGAGLREAGGGMVRGARQLFNKLTGDEAELAELNQQEEAARKDWEQRSAEHTIAGGAGKLVGSIGAPLLAAGALPAGGAVGAAGLGARALAGGLSGAAGGAAQPLTGQEEAGGDRMGNAALGGTIGGVVPGVTAGASILGNALRKVKPDEAIEDFAKRALGASHSKGAAGAYGAVNDSIESQYTKLRDTFSKLYDDVEKVDLPPVKLQSSSRLSEEVLDLPEEISNALKPTAKRVAEALKRGSTKTSAIVDTSGRPIKDAREVSFADVRDTIRELRAAKRALPYTDNGIQQSKRLDALIQNLDDDLNSWGQSIPEAGTTLQAAKQLDAEYAQQVAPFSSKDAPIGKFRRGVGDERNFDRQFLRDDSGSAMSDLLKRVPDSKGAARELYGHKLMTPQGPTTKARTLQGGTLGEALLSKSERDYLKKVADAVQEGKSYTGALSPTLERILKVTGAEKLDTMLHGVEKYGQGRKNSTIIADMLRSMSAGQLATEE